MKSGFPGDGLHGVPRLRQQLLGICNPAGCNILCKIVAGDTLIQPGDMGFIVIHVIRYHSKAQILPIQNNSSASRFR